MSLVEPITALSARLRPHFASSVQDEAGRTVVRFPGTRIPILIEATSAPDLIRISAEVGRILDWSRGLSDCLLRRNATLGLPAFSRHGETLTVAARLPGLADDSAIAEAVRAVADVVADTRRELDHMGVTEPAHDL